MKRIVIFASGSGTNAQNIIQYFNKHHFAKVVLVLSNKKDSKVLKRAEKLNVKNIYFNKEELTDPNGVLNLLRGENPDLIVLAGFLLRFPKFILDEFPNKVINIHPALLPKYGGKGMYGRYVHESVIDNKESESGISIHYVNEYYDEGAIIFQKSIPIENEDTPESLAEKIHQLEYRFFPKVVEEVIFSEGKDINQ
jgi:phosphoribosylglycinamide formyltransferase-1